MELWKRLQKLLLTWLMDRTLKASIKQSLSLKIANKTEAALRVCPSGSCSRIIINIEKLQGMNTLSYMVKRGGNVIGAGRFDRSPCDVHTFIDFPYSTEVLYNIYLNAVASERELLVAVTATEIKGDMFNLLGCVFADVN